MFTDKYFDKDGNFNNSKFLTLIKKANKKIQQTQWKKKSEAISFDFFSSVSKKDMWRFINKLSWFLNSWMDVKTSLSIVSTQLNNPFFEKIIVTMKNNIDFWILISDTMKQYPKVFDNLTISLISIWEKTGNLWDILKKMDEKMLEQIELTAKVKWALMYPVILLVLTIAMVIFMMTYIIPKITDTFKKTWVELPWLTQFVISVSDFLQAQWWWIILGIIFLVIWLNLMRKTLHWEMLVWKIMIEIPIFWYIIKRSNVIYFINSFSLLLESWVLMIEALEASGKLLPNIHYRREIMRIKREVESWITFSKSLWLNLDSWQWIYMNNLFEEEFAYIINMWEETWTLSKSIARLWNNYNSELKRYIWNLSTMLEPFIIVIVWALVWIIVIAIMLPFFSIWKVVKSS